MEILSKLFSTEARVKIMRLFLFNADQTFSLSDIASRSNVSLSDARKEIAVLSRAKMLRSHRFSHTVARTARGKVNEKRVTEKGFFVDQNFPYLIPLQRLLINDAMIRPASIARRLQSVGRIKMILTAGVFIQDADSRVDLLVVGEGIVPGALERVVKSIESEIGKELRYAAFETDDFKYRFGMYDKLVRDILEYPHRIIVDKLGFR